MTSGPRISDMRNLGPATERMLAEIDIVTPDELRAIGAGEAYRRLRFRHSSVSRNALYALRGALADTDWRREADPGDGLRVVAGDRSRHAAACAAVLDEWIETTPWMPRLHTSASIRDHVSEVVFGMRRVWVAERAGAALGFLAMDIEDCVTALYVAAGERGRGAGRMLLDAAKGEAGAGLDLWTFEANEGARRFYAREGFVECERTDGDNEEGLPDLRLEWSRDGARRQGGAS